MSNPVLSIIIVSYNTKELLCECLHSVYRQTDGPEFEIIVVDNNSQDGSAEEIQARFPKVKVISNRKNRGFAAASNQGLKIMRGKYALLLNPDTLIMDNALAKMVDFMSKHDRLGALCPKILTSDGSLQRAAFPPPSAAQFILSRLDKKTLFSGRVRTLYRRFIDPILPARLSNGHYDRLSRTSPEPFRAGWVSGACLMTRREAIESVGYLDENLFLYCEDRDWCCRAQEMDWDVMFFPGARIMHYGGQSVEQASSSGIPLYHRAQFYFVRKHMGMPTLIILKFMVFWELLFKIVISGMNSLVGRGKSHTNLGSYVTSLKSVFESSRRGHSGFRP